MADSPPQDMRTSIAGKAQTQKLAYQYNFMEFTYKMACGAHDVTLTPSKSFLQLTTSGKNLSPDGKPFPDTLTLSGTTLADVGVHHFKITVS